ncbi:MAG: hypothetical protein ORO03_01045, partial [Alphaproteobacteria bacterium]|nr:hypothetical protein [Alphaproteobacteria bacterium]
MADDIVIDPRDRIGLSQAARPDAGAYSPRDIGRTAKLVGSAAVAAILSLSSPKLLAAPVGGVVASGGATISASGLVTTINQSTDRAVIDWSSFNLSVNETARFIVPSDSSATLNRITGGGVSTISG